MLTYVVPEAVAPMSLRDFIRHQCGLSQTLWRRIRREGSALCNGFALQPGQMLRAGDILVLDWPKSPPAILSPLPLSIRYEDESLLVVDKPAGLLAHPHAGPPEPTLADAVLTHYRQHGWDYEYHPVHRLDRNTSGLVLVAKRPDVQHYFQRQSLRLLQRFYLGVCHGRFSSARGLIDAPIGRKEGSLIERTVSPEGQAARTRYLRCKANCQASLMRFSLQTGRTHQIRVHCSHLGHPLLGDDLYGGSREHLARQALHAYRLQFVHPSCNRLLRIYAPVPADLQQLLQRLGLCQEK